VPSIEVLKFLRTSELQTDSWYLVAVCPIKPRYKPLLILYLVRVGKFGTVGVLFILTNHKNRMTFFSANLKPALNAGLVCCGTRTKFFLFSFILIVFFG
jgi:hypothetical protein